MLVKLNLLLLQVRLVVIDSIAAPFRQNFDDMRTRTSMLQSISQELNKLAAEHNLAVCCFTFCGHHILSRDGVFRF